MNGTNTTMRAETTQIKPGAAATRTFYQGLRNIFYTLGTQSNEFMARPGEGTDDHVYW